MIPKDILDETVLRRTLEDLEARLIGTKVAISPINSLPESSDLSDVILKVNEIISSFNTLITTLNKGSNSNLY